MKRSPLLDLDAPRATCPRRIHRPAVWGLAMGLVFTNAHGDDSFEFRSRESQTALLELYTSEGCSSCPPAEVGWSKLKTSAGLWLDFVPIAFHVDYWDDLGWPDPFATPTASKRQRAYAATWLRPSVYTPGFILNGLERGSRVPAEPMIARPLPLVGILTAGSADGIKWTLSFRPTAPAKVNSYLLHGALLGFDLKTDVTAGENRGRTLNHDFVSLVQDQNLAAPGKEVFQGVISLPCPSPLKAGRLGVAAWVTTGKSISPLQATGGWLSSTNRHP